MRTVAFDTETRGLDWFDGQTAFLASWADDEGEYVADLSDEAQAATFLSALTSADVIVAHNFSFDAHQVRETLGFDILNLKAELWDTDLMSRVLHPEGQRKGARGGHGLKNLAKIYVDEKAGDSEAVIEELGNSIGVKLKGDNATIGAYHDVWKAYPIEMETYAKEDARFTHAIFNKFGGEIDGPYSKCLKLEYDTMPVLIEAEKRGVAIDQGAVTVQKKKYEQQQSETHEYLETELGTQALGGEGSEDALIEALLKQGIPLKEKTDSGKYATNKFALEKFEDDFPVIEKLFEFRTATKFLSTYINPMVGREVVHPSFRQIGAWTGRMSCMRPNMQNIPKRAGKEVRSMFVPRPGYSFVVFDYESIEVRLLAWYLGNQDFRKLIRDGHDPHAWMASNIHGGAVESYHKGTPGQAQRDIAKNTLFAITYGAGGPRVSNMNKLDPGPYDKNGKPQHAEAKALIKKIKGSLPGYYKLMKRVRTKVENEGFVNTLWGRKQLVKKDKAYVGLNALIQGSAADIMKQGLVNVAEAVKPHGAYPLLVVHDEVVVEVPNEEVPQVTPLVVEALVAAWPLDPQLAVEGKAVTTSYADA